MLDAIKAAAKERAWRTFLQNIWIDICLVAGPQLYALITGAHSLDKSYWVPGLLSIGKTAALVAIAYVMRLKRQPKSEVAKPTQ